MHKHTGYLAKNNAMLITDGGKNDDETVTSRIEASEQFGSELSTITEVRHVSVNSERVPPRVRIEFDDTVTELPGSIKDRLDTYNAAIKDIEVDSDTLIVTVTVGGRWENVGTRSVSTHGNSPCLILLQEFQARSNITFHDRVRVHARDGEIKFTKIEV